MRVCIGVVLCSITVILLCSEVNTQNATLEVHKGLTERIGNFSLELLYYTSKQQKPEDNFIMAPMTVWSVLAVTAEGAINSTMKEINDAIRVTKRGRTELRKGFQNIARWLNVNTSTIQLAKINAIFVDRKVQLYPDFRSTARYYDTYVVPLDFDQGDATANYINGIISNVTHGGIPNLVDGSYFTSSKMVITSAVHFKGQWSLPFDPKSTKKMPFFNTEGQTIGEVNMMSSRSTFAFANIRHLQARVIELPYGKENRLSMLVMLPYTNVSIEQMYANFESVPLDTLFSTLKKSREEFAEDEVECFIPRFKIESEILLNDILMKSFNITSVFDKSKSALFAMSRLPLYVSRVVHKAKIEVTEEGTIASGATVAEFTNRIGAIRFEVNRPFVFMIVEKITNSILFGGFYRVPSLF